MLGLRESLDRQLSGFELTSPQGTHDEPPLTPRFVSNNPDDSEMIVSLAPLDGCPDDDNSREIRVSCPDATGLGCDLAREILNFGLRIIRGDFSTDGKWCFLIFEVRVGRGYRPYWDRLKRQLERCCPKEGSAGLQQMCANPSARSSQLFVLQVTTSDRSGVLHNLISTLWECDLQVHKAHITTNPGDQALDMFWVSDNRQELPALERMLDIRDRVKAALGEQSSCHLETVAPEDMPDLDARAVRLACKDAKAQDPLRLHKASPSGPGAPTHRHRRTVSHEIVQEVGLLPLDSVDIVVDNSTSREHTLITIACRDRKGLTYDIMRVLKDQEVRIAYGRIGTDDMNPTGVVVDLFLQQEFESWGICDEDLLEDLVETLRTAIAMPVTITITDVFDGACTQLTVRASVDSGGRGRPRVIYDTTRAVALCRCGIFMADMFMEEVGEDDTLMGPRRGRRRVEVHRFLIHDEEGRPLRSREQKQVLLSHVKHQMIGCGDMASVAGLPCLSEAYSRIHSVNSFESVKDSVASAAGSMALLNLPGLMDDAPSELRERRPSRLGRVSGDPSVHAGSAPLRGGLEAGSSLRVFLGRSSWRGIREEEGEGEDGAAAAGALAGSVDGGAEWLRGANSVQSPRVRGVASEAGPLGPVRPSVSGVERWLMERGEGAWAGDAPGGQPGLLEGTPASEEEARPAVPGPLDLRRGDSVPSPSQDAARPEASAGGDLAGAGAAVEACRDGAGEAGCECEGALAHDGAAEAAAADGGAWEPEAGQVERAAGLEEGSGSSEAAAVADDAGAAADGAEGAPVGVAGERKPPVDEADLSTEAGSEGGSDVAHGHRENGLPQGPSDAGAVSRGVAQEGARLGRVRVV